MKTVELLKRAQPYVGRCSSVGAQELARDIAAFFADPHLDVVVHGALVSPRLTQGVMQVLAERIRQVGYGYTAEHDDDQPFEHLILAAICYAEEVASPSPDLALPERWPWTHYSWRPASDSHRNLVKAAALLLAALDYLNRNKVAGETQP